MSKPIEVEREVFGLTVTATIRDAGWEGDPSIPNGTHELGWEIEEMIITTPDGYDITEYLTAEAIGKIEEAIWMEADECAS